MEIVGIYFDGEQYYIAGMTQQEKIAFLEIKKKLDASVQWGVSLLAEVALKSFEVPITNKKAILAGVPFQAEELLPFPYEEAIVIPVIENKKVLLFAAKKETLHKHLEKWDTPFVSSYQMALYRYIAWAHPEKKEGVVCFQGKEKSFFIALRQGNIYKSGVLIAPYDEEMKERLLSYLGSCDIFYVDAHAIAMGLSLDVIKQDGRSTQFRQGENEHPLLQKVKWKSLKRFLGVYFAALLSVGFAVWVVGYRDEARLEALKSSFAKEYSYDIGSLLKVKEERVLFYGKAPQVTAVIAYLEQFNHLIEIDSMKIELLQYPSLKEPTKKYKMQVKLHFQPLSPQGAKLFQDHLMGKNRWVDGKEDIEFKRFHDGYQATFILAS